MKENQYIKESINQIDIPVNKLNSIIDQSFANERKLQRKTPLKRGLKYVATAVAISTIVVFSATVSPAFANFVQQFPLIGQAFEHFISKEDYYEEYEKMSTDIFATEQSNDVPLIIEQAFYDGNTVILSYIIKTKERWEFPVFNQLPTVNAHFDGIAYDSEYVEGLGYVGMMRVDVHDPDKDPVMVTWEPEAISTFEGDEKVEGDWKFEFPLEATETHKVSINKKVTKDLVTVELVDVIKTNVNMSINYIQDIDPALHEHWEAVEAELVAVDNLGNRYEVPYNGGRGIVDGDSREDMIWNATIHGLNPEATSITFYPFATVSYYRSENDSDSKRINFDPITIKMDVFTK